MFNELLSFLNDSFNKFIGFIVFKKSINSTLFSINLSKLKTLYYCRSEKIGKADKVAKKIERQVMQEIDLKQLATEETVCIACEGWA